MTILIAGTIEISAAGRTQALAESAELVRQTRLQAGCRHYVWSADPTSESRVYVYENWASTEELAAHLAGPFYMQMLVLLGKYDVSDTQVSKFKVALEEPVYDSEGKPRADFFTQ
ncbi:MAG: antibiotic biosynthesis monooxygenase [Halioglobus sp.]